MLAYVLNLVQQYERTHGREPNTLFINPQHAQALEESCPGLLSDQPPIPLGLAVQIRPASSLPHPHVAYLDTPRMEALETGASLQNRLQRLIRGDYPPPRATPRPIDYHSRLL